MKGYLAIVLAIAVLVPVGCGTGLIEEAEVLEGDIQSQQDPVIQKTLAAADIGMQAGDNLMAQKVNEVLQTYGVGYFYHGMSTLADYSDMDNPDVGGPASCPYVGPTAVSGNDSGPSSCRFLAEEAKESAQLAMDALNPNQAIDEEFSEGDGNLPTYRAWYANGALSSVQITGVLLAGTLRKAGVCDNAPSPKQAAYNEGVKLGRRLYIESINNRLKEIGIDFTYPNGKNPSKSIRFCKANLRDPAIQDATDRIASTVQAEPLCSSIGADPIEQSGFLAQYREVEKEYKAGVLSGVMQEDELAQGTLKGGGVCIASPLVLDLGGDGIAPGGAARFDLLAAGHKVTTSWIRGDDALLVLDANNNGRVDDASELFGNQDGAASGFESLARHDTNSDGVIDSRDAVYDELQLWQDANGDGTSEADELSSLPAMGVKAIELRYTEGARVDRHGNQFRQSARFLRTAEFAGELGSAGKVVDVWFAYR